jgi:K+-sensing histidine kinase KdpD
MKYWVRGIVGTGVCLGAAAILSFLFRASPLKSWLPLLFFGVLIFVATRFGSVSGILGTLGAAIVFAEFLFQPTLSLRVNDSIQRGNLIWMIIMGMAASQLAGAPSKGSGHGDEPRGTAAQ